MRYNIKWLKRGNVRHFNITNSYQSLEDDPIKAGTKSFYEFLLRDHIVGVISSRMDKASVLGDAIKYLKHLQEHLKLLEKQITKKSEESIVFVKKSQLSGNDDTSSCDENFDGRMKEVLPEIEARISEKNVLIRVHCEKQKGFAVKLLSEIEKNHLSIVNSSFLPFGQDVMDITVVAQMDADICMTVKDLARNLRSAFVKFVV